MARKIIFLFIVFAANIIQCITGFAGTVLAMPFSIITVGYQTAEPILNVLGIGASVVIVARDYRYINKKEFFKITAVMLIGTAAGIFLKDLIGSGSSLFYKILGGVVIAFAIYNAYRFYTKKEDKGFPAPISALLLAASGIIHGLYVCGGPLLVTYLSGVIKEKKEFRSTVSAVWIVLNSVIMCTDIKSGYFSKDELLLLLVSFAALAAAMAVGNIIYKKLSKGAFLQLSYILMFISGISLFVK